MNQGNGKVLVLNPMRGTAKSRENLKAFFASEKDVDVVHLSEGPEIMHYRGENALVAADSVAKAREAEKAGYGAIVMVCHGDPNLYALRDAVRIPVIGVIELAMHFCAMLAHRFSILTPSPAVQKWQEENVVQYGFASKVASIRVVPWKVSLGEASLLVAEAVLKGKPIPKDIIEPALEECIKAIEEDGAEALTPGCGAFRMLTDELGKRLKERGYDGVPLINPLRLGVDVARVLVRHKLSHSLLSYPSPREW